MSIESNKELVRQFYASVDRHDLEGVMAMFADDIVLHTAPPGRAAGIEGARQGVARVITAFTELHTTVDLLVAEDDFVTAVHTHDGVQGGPYGIIPPTGKSIHINGIEVFRILDGKITEFWQRDDELGALVQLGVIPMPGG